MEQFIKYFYGLTTHEIRYDKSMIAFEIDGGKYILKEINEQDISKVLKSIGLVKKQNSKYHEPVYTKLGELLSNINGKFYILLKISMKSNRKVELEDLLSFTANDVISCTNYRPGENWVQLWENKVDLLEEWLLGKTNILKQNKYIFEYYIGLSETALSLLRNTLIEYKNNMQGNMQFQHYRVHESDTLMNYYDPTNLMLDHIGRDIGEYIKDTIINEKFKFEHFKQVFNASHFSDYDIKLIYARIMFPSFFFDYIEGVISSNASVDDNYLQKMAFNYEKGISLIAGFFAQQYNIDVLIQ